MDKDWVTYEEADPIGDIKKALGEYSFCKLMKMLWNEHKTNTPVECSDCRFRESCNNILKGGRRGYKR